MSPTVFREGPFRFFFFFFFFFSREEERMHIHVQSPDGEAKFWIELRTSAESSEREQEIRDACQRRFRS